MENIISEASNMLRIPAAQMRLKLKSTAPSFPETHLPFVQYCQHTKINFSDLKSIPVALNF